MISLITLKQGDKESLLSFLERFKSERNVVVTLLGDKLIDGYVENTQEYCSIPGGGDQLRLQKKM